MKKIGAVFLVLLVLSSFAFAKGTAEAKSDKISICITDDREAWVNARIKEYNAINPNVKIETIVLSGGSSDRQAKMTMMMQSPQTSPDIMNEDGFKINADSAAGFLYPLDEYIANWNEWDQFYDNVKEMGRAVDGKIYGIPLTVDVLGLWYDKGLMKEAGVPMPFAPKSWKDVLDAANKIKALGKKDVIPYFITTAKTFPERASMRLFQPLYNGTGHSIYNAELGKWTINKKAFLDVCNYVNQICNGDKVGPPLDLGVQNQVESVIQSSLMKEGKVGIWLSGNWMCRNWAPGMQYEWPEVTEKVGFVPIPTQFGQDPHFTSMSGGWTFAIPQNANNKDAAWEFLKFLGSKESYLDMAMRTSELTVRKDVADEASYKDPSRLYIREASEILDYTEFRPSLDVYPRVSLLCTEAMESIGLNTATPEAVYKTFITSLREVVGAENLIVD
ncbi:MAG: extracellular solute-binding protein [Sphaerochaeta sp.]|nr:extracellular solute-binding protein [Sphaerochaeta sp.]